MVARSDRCSYTHPDEDQLVKENKVKITKEMSIGEIVRKYPQTVPVFMQHGLGCIGCAAAHFENLEQGAMAHGIDIETLVKALNEVVAEPAASATKKPVAVH